MARVRVKEAVIVRDPDGGGALVALKPDTAYDASDSLVKTYPWAFDSDDNTPAEPRRRRNRVGGVEQATAAPGELRDVSPRDLAG